MTSRTEDSYRESLSYLYGLQKIGMKFGLENTRSLLTALSNPHLAFPSAHIAGTNGKGSTAAFLASILMEMGWKVGLYTSPHLVDFTERIRVNGKPIAQERLARYVAELRPEIDRLNATFFEATTAIAFHHFAIENVDAAVIETGLGGRLDSTNVLAPKVAIITNIALEHTEYLGDTTAAIAFEKAGIIKRGTPLITAVQDEDANAVILHRARELDAPVISIDTEPIELRIDAVDRMLFRSEIIEGEFSSPLIGCHQYANALLALTAASQCFEAGFDARRNGIAHVRENTGLRGRLERVHTDPEVVIDVAHNADGVRRLSETWSAIRDTRRTHLVFGVQRTKDIHAIIDVLSQWEWASLCPVQSRHEEALPRGEIIRALDKPPSEHCTEQSAATAVEFFLERGNSGESLLIFGSHYLIGELLEEKKFNSFSTRA